MQCQWLKFIPSAGALSRTLGIGISYYCVDVVMLLCSEKNNSLGYTIALFLDLDFDLSNVGLNS